MTSLTLKSRYDVIIAGARAAGAATALLLSRAGYDVLLVDRASSRIDTLSTHALMRGGVERLARWGLLPDLVGHATPRIETTTFHYADEELIVPIRSRGGVEALYAPRRTVLDPVLWQAAADAGATVMHGMGLSSLEHAADGRVCGVIVGDRQGRQRHVDADLVIGADGRNSTVARLVGAPVRKVATHQTATVYGYYADLDVSGYHWYYGLRQSAALIPTNDGLTCVSISVSPKEYDLRQGDGIARLFDETLREMSTELWRTLLRGRRVGTLRRFRGARGYLRRSVGPGWALVGDAGYFKDPLTAHGITDALCDAELLASALVEGEQRLPAYEHTRDQRSRALFEVTDRIASFDWDMTSIKELHLQLNHAMRERAAVGLLVEDSSSPSALMRQSA
jgi:2-polyprenyl-6-methoxyphenol hydroxylase-like FAD-dependent oxidoreductase